MANAPLLQLTDAQVKRAGKIILAVDELTLHEGESIAVLGPNGSGKSTFVNLITREVFPLHRDEPPVVFRGQPRMELSDAKKCTGVISSTMDSQIRRHYTALEIVTGGLFGCVGIPLRITPTEEQFDTARRALEELGITYLADRDITTMSTGQVRRVLAARALIHNPDVLVFDEPCTGLDPEGMFYLRRTMRNLIQGGHSIVLVTHYLEDIVPEIDRILLIKDGKIIDSGCKKDILTSEKMSSLFEIPVTVAEEDGHYYTKANY